MSYKTKKLITFGILEDDEVIGVRLLKDYEGLEMEIWE
jgi:hypothetical protein